MGWLSLSLGPEKNVQAGVLLIQMRRETAVSVEPILFVQLARVGSVG
jgi:hypothetical protein